jgi:hypothetical protein
MDNKEMQQSELLAVLLDILIPGSTDGRLPSAATLDLFLTPEPWLLQGLHNVDAAAQERLQSSFLALAREQQEALVGELRRKMFSFFSDLGKQLIQGYYQDERVVKAIGGEIRPPFPLGYFVIDGDFDLLEPVFERGSMYRRF